MPPISRFETAHGYLPSTPPLGRARSPSPRLSRPPVPLRAVELRRLLRRTLREATSSSIAAAETLDELPRREAELRALLELYAATPAAIRELDPPRRKRLSLASVHSADSPARRRESWHNPLRLSIGPPGSSAMMRQALSADGPASAPLGDAPWMDRGSELMRSRSSAGGHGSPLRPSSARNSIAFSHPPTFGDDGEVDDIETDGAYGDGSEDLSLLAIKRDFERAHGERKRVLCILLALEYVPRRPPPTVYVAALADAFVRMRADLVAAAEREMGRGCLDTATPTRPAPPPADDHLGTRRSSDTLRGFAPASAPEAVRRQRVDTFVTQMSDMATSIRQISAKLHVVSDDVRGEPDDAAARAVQMHDSVRADLERLLRDWDDSRLALRQAVAPPASLPVRPGVERKSSVQSSVAPSIPEETDDDDEQAESSADLLATPDLSPHLPADLAAALVLDDVRPEALPAPGGVELLFEGTAGTVAAGGVKLSREDRIRLAREQRERLAAQPPAPPQAPVAIVNELKDGASARCERSDVAVLASLQERRRTQAMR